jgi:hypothetical protein
MEAQIIQARPQITFVRSLGRCEDCEEEERCMSSNECGQ